MEADESHRMDAIEGQAERGATQSRLRAVVAQIAGDVLPEVVEHGSVEAVPEVFISSHRALQGGVAAVQAGGEVCANGGIRLPPQKEGKRAEETFARIAGAEARKEAGGAEGAEVASEVVEDRALRAEGATRLGVVAAGGEMGADSFALETKPQLLRQLSEIGVLREERWLHGSAGALGMKFESNAGRMMESEAL